MLFWGICMVIRAKSLKIAVLCIFLGLLVGISAKYIKGGGSQSAFSDMANALVVCDAGHGEYELYFNK